MDEEDDASENHVDGCRVQRRGEENENLLDDKGVLLIVGFLRYRKAADNVTENLDCFMVSRDLSSLHQMQCDNVHNPPIRNGIKYHVLHRNSW
jgi:hypothetical protein